MSEADTSDFVDDRGEVAGDDVAEADPEAVEAAEIRADIEDTRVEMGDTLQELGDRLDPGNLVEQAKENVREATIGRVEETAKGMSDMVMDTIRRNPIPAAMAGAGLALLWMNRSNDSSNGKGRSASYERYGPYRSGMRYDDRRTSGADEPGITDRAGDVVSSVGQTVGDTVGQVSQRVGEVGQTVGSSVGQGVEQTTWRFERLMDSSPLAVGAIALGAGALVGAVLPETPEQRVLAEPARAVGETVRQAVSDATDKIEEGLDTVDPGKVSASRS
jgi:hypothetical protein